MSQFGCWLSLTDGRKILDVTFFTPVDAVFALDVLSSPDSDRRAYAAGMMNCLMRLSQAKQLTKGACVQANRRDPHTGLLVGGTVNVPCKVASYIARAIQLKPGGDLEYLKHDLRRIAEGTLSTNKQIRHPFLVEEGRIRASLN